MAVSLKHSKTSAVTDSGDTTLVQPSDWNAEHVLTQGTGTLLGRTTAGTGATEEISPSSELTLTSGTLGIASSIGGKTLTSATVITDNSSSAALRITQTGAGNSLLVEDEANPDATPFQVNASGQVSIGTTTAAGRLNIYHDTTATVNLSGDSATAINSTRYSSDTTTTNIQMRKARGTLASPTAVNSGDGTGILIYNAYGGTNFRQIATIAAPVDTYTSDTNISGLLTFSTNSGGTAVTEKMRISAAGNVGIGTSTPTEKLVVAGPTIVGGQTTANQTSAGSFDHNIAANSTRILSWGASGVTGDITFWTGSGNSGATQRMRIEGGGNVGIGTATPTQMLTVNGAVGYNAPVTVTDATHTVADTTNWLIANRAGTVTLTLPAAASYTGRILTVKNVQAQTVVSNASNVVPIGSTTAGTAILAATAGKFATMVSNGTNWVIMQAN